jgi:cellobiose transport system substrate-binding protein
VGASTTRRRARRLAALLLATSALLAAGIAASGAGAASGAEKITLRVDLFGDFGYHDLYKQFMKSHPNVTIKEDIESYADHHSNLAKHLATGSGAADVVAIEVGFIAQFAATPQYFVDLGDYGLDKLKKRWLPWKYDQAVARGGDLVGLGTDVGSLGICYRRDLFQQAGLPSSRAAVSKLWPTWDAYMKTGKRFKAKAPKGVSFFDSGSNVYNAIVGQLNPAYYDRSGEVIADSNPGVKRAWSLTMTGVKGGLSAGLAAFSPGWNTGFKKGTFATVTCPAWMMGYIQGQAPATKGMWDIAAVPGGGGNWGGSFLSVPKQSKHQKEAVELATFLTSPAAESYVFKQTGNLPSQPGLYASKAITGFKNPFFNNAPVGRIFTTSARRLKPQILGPHQGDIQTAVSNAIQRVEQKKQTPDKSWSQFLKDVEAATS